MNFDYDTAQYFAEDVNMLLKYVSIFLVFAVLSFIIYPIFKYQAKKAKQNLVFYAEGDTVEDYKKKYDAAYKITHKYDTWAGVFSALGGFFFFLTILVWLFGNGHLATRDTHTPFRAEALKVINTTYDVNFTNSEVKKLFNENFSYDEEPTEEYVLYGTVETLTEDDTVVSMKLVWVRDEFRLIYTSEGSELVEVDKR